MNGTGEAIVATFFLYNATCEIAFGRCLGSRLMGLRWCGEPSLPRRLLFCVTYSTAFSLWILLPWWQAIPHLMAQWLWGELVGGTIHSSLVGLKSEPICLGS